MASATQLQTRNDQIFYRISMQGGMLETFPRGTSMSFVETDWMVFDILWISQRAARDSEISQRYY